MDILKKDKLGVRSIDSIKPSDAKEWAIRMSEMVMLIKPSITTNVL